MLILGFDRAPARGTGYLRAVLGVTKPRTALALPMLQARRDGVTIDAAAVVRFRQLFGLPADGPVPPTYAHVLAGPLHLAVLTHPTFPLRVPGTVHVRNPIVQTRPLRVGERVDLVVVTGDLRQTPRGVEYELLTEVRAEGVLVWRGVSVHLLRAPREGKPPAAPGTGKAADGWPRVWTVDLPAATGRRYAAQSGDWNPIHLSLPTARLFGFRRAIAHGMWTCARVLAALEAHLPSETLSLDIDFRRPILLPGRIRIGARDTAGGREWAFAVEDARGTIEHARGRVLCPRSQA